MTTTPLPGCRSSNFHGYGLSATLPRVSVVTASLPTTLTLPVRIERR